MLGWRGVGVCALRTHSLRRAPLSVALQTQSRFMSDETSSEGESPYLTLYDRIQETLLQKAPVIQAALRGDGPGYLFIDDLANTDEIRSMRGEAEDMWDAGNFTQSLSAKLDDDGNEQVFVKEGVFSTELEGGEGDIAPYLLHYTAAMAHTMPQIINHYFPHVQMSTAHYGTKLACATGGSKYPKHIDNVGLPDTRKLTCVFYLNPDWQEGDGGELRVWGHPDIVEDVPPSGGRLALFWSDLLVHEVLSAREGDDLKRYALTLWFVTERESQVSDSAHPLFSSRFEHFGEDGSLPEP